MARTANPVIDSFSSFTGSAYGVTTRATIGGVLQKTALGLVTVVAAAAGTWRFLPFALMNLAGIGAAVAAVLLTFFLARRATIGAGSLLAFSALEGVFVGATSRIFEYYYPGIATQALLATVVVAGITLMVYSFSGLRVGPKFRRMVGVATLGLLAMYLINLALSLFQVNTGLVQTGTNAGLLSMGISAVAVLLATFNLVIDFDDINRMVEQGAPVEQEWRGALGLIATLVWLYVELIRIASYFRNN